MANGEDWEDISDGGDDDWEMGKPIAPRSGSGSGSFRTGSNGSSAAPKSHHRPQSSWGDDDWGGDEESWRPGPANPSLMHASGTRATPPRSPALTKGVSPARPAMGSRRWTRSRAACKRLGVLVCLVAAVVTLSSFGILKGGGSGGGPVDARGWRPSDASDAFERTARSFEERPSADPGPARQWDSSNSFVPASSGASRERFGFREEKAPATRDAPASDRETPVVQEAQVATIGASETVSVSQRVADEIQRLRASHEHVSNAADAADAAPTEEAISAANSFSPPEGEKLTEGSAEEDVFASRVDAASDAASLEPRSIESRTTERASVPIEDDEANGDESGGRDERVEAAADRVDVEVDDDDDDDDDDDETDRPFVFGEILDAAPLVPTEDASSDATKDDDAVFGETVVVVPSGGGSEDDANSAEAEVSAEAFAAFGDMLEEASVNDAGIMTTAEGEEAEGEEAEGEEAEGEEAEGEEAGDSADEGENVAADVATTTTTTTTREGGEFGSTLDPRALEEEAFSSSNALIDGEASSVESDAVVTAPDAKPDASSARVAPDGAADETAPPRADGSARRARGVSPPPPPVPMDGPDMTDPANRAVLDAYQSREKYVAWSKRAAKIEGRTVAPPNAARRRR